MPGAFNSKVEVVQVTPFGVWLAWGTEDLFLDHDLFPWFRRAAVDHILNVVEQGEGHFYWPDLDVDLDVDCIRNPERYPLVAQRHRE